MNRLLETAPYLARCSDNKTASHVRPRSYAINWPYMQINRSDMVSWLIFDLDHSNPNIWDDQDLPAPNFIVRDKTTNRSHLYYAIVPVCTGDKARSKPILFMRRVYQAMAKAMGADTSYAGTVAKTPHHPTWTTTELHGYVYELGELAGHIEIEYVPPWAKKEAQDTSHSRNCTLFEELRHFAYSIVGHDREHSNYESFKGRLELYADKKNNFSKRGWDSNLGYSEIKATVKSVARWTWDHYTVTDCVNRGVMNLDASLPAEKRKSLAAFRTHNQRRSETAKKILTVTQELVKSKEEATYTAVAKLAGLTRQTVAKYRTLIELVLNRPNIISLGEIFRARPIVNYAVSDISPFESSNVSPVVFGLGEVVVPFPVSSRNKPMLE